MADRRQVLSWLGLAAGTLLASLVAVPAGIFLRRTSSARAPDWLPLAEMDALVDGVPTPVRMTGRAGRDAWMRLEEIPLGVAWLVRRGSQVTAFTSACPHAACFVDFDSSAGHFVCPCHDSSFSLEGAPLEGPAPRGLDALPVKLEGGKVWVRPTRYRHGVAVKEPLA